MVIFLTMYTTVIERTRDIGVLKSMGANRSFIVRVLMTESAALCAFRGCRGNRIELRWCARHFWRASRRFRF